MFQTDGFPSVLHDQSNRVLGFYQSLSHGSYHELNHITVNDSCHDNDTPISQQALSHDFDVFPSHDFSLVKSTTNTVCRSQSPDYYILTCHDMTACACLPISVQYLGLGVMTPVHMTSSLSVLSRLDAADSWVRDIAMGRNMVEEHIYGVLGLLAESGDEADLFKVSTVSQQTPNIPVNTTLIETLKHQFETSVHRMT
jgi:hypothetical protein